MSNVDLKSRFMGALVGTAIGDALGAPVEGWSMERVSSMYSKGKGWKMIYGRYTDDTEMMIGVAESLIEHKGFNGAHMARVFIQNYDAGRGYSPWTVSPPCIIVLNEHPCHMRTIEAFMLD